MEKWLFYKALVPFHCNALQKVVHLCVHMFARARVCVSKQESK